VNCDCCLSKTIATELDKSLIASFDQVFDFKKKQNHPPNGGCFGAEKAQRMLSLQARLQSTKLDGETSNG